ncbi:MAG: GNAT family N-acetyltransferase [Salinisphaeraceae bacterium]
MADGITLRTAETDADLDHITALAHRIWHEHYPGIITREQIDYMLAHGYSRDRLRADTAAGVRYVMAHTDPTKPAVAFAAHGPDETDASRFWLHKLYVDRAERGRGLARQLVNAALLDARQQDCEKLWLRVNRDNHLAVASYRRLGFTVAAEHVQDIGGGFVMDDYLMAQPVNAKG